MSRIFLTWELGLNLGHLARLLPVASRLKARGHDVLVAVREIPAAASVLGPAGIPFVQAPYSQQHVPMPPQASGYADILLSRGWGDINELWGLAQSWLALLKMVQPDIVVHNHSPTAQLATKIAQIPAVLIGNGFELPPATSPLPAFPDLSWATAEKAEISEQLAIRNANEVASRFNHRGIRGLRDLFDDTLVLLATFPELDHFGPREHGQYVGPLLGKIRRTRVDWPEGRRHIFACVRPDTDNVDALLGALHESDASVVCFAPGFIQERLRPFYRSGICFISHTIDLAHLVADADVCVSYGGEGTVVVFLLAGVPQLLAPSHLEAHLAARRIEGLGAGIVLRGTHAKESVLTQLERVITEPQFKAQADVFAERHCDFRSDAASDAVAELIEARAASVVGNRPI